jgi:hypothetical protein
MNLLETTRTRLTPGLMRRLCRRVSLDHDNSFRNPALNVNRHRPPPAPHSKLNAAHEAERHPLE